MPRVAILSTGNELVCGRTTDTNAAFLSERLFAAGFRVVMHMAVGDSVDDIDFALGECESRADIVILTGGLGPTDDDHTLAAMRKHYNLGELIDEQGKGRMESFFSSMGRTPMPGDLKMVTVPENALVFPNDRGLALGYAVVHDKKTIIAMPGVPTEMEYMFEHRVMPYLCRISPAGRRESVEIRVAMMREAEVNLLVKGMKIPLDTMDWGITTRPGLNTVVFVAREGADFPAQGILEEAKNVFGHSLLRQGARGIEEEVEALLSERDMTIAVAESCTGGLVAKCLTDIPGSSRVFLGGVVAYDNEAKKKLLSVPDAELSAHGAVSEEVALSMALGARRRFGSSIAISTTGIAGPGGGSEKKPVGTVCFGLAFPDRNETETRSMAGDRARVRMFAAQYAMDRVRLYLRGG